MNNIYIQPVGKENENYHTIEYGVDCMEMKAYVEENKMQQLLKCAVNGRVALFAVGSKHKDKWANMRRGDVILFSGNNCIMSYGYISCTFYSKKLADILYKSEEYAYFYVIENLTMLEMPYAVFNGITGYSWNYVPRAFMQLPEMKATHFIEQRGWYKELIRRIIENKIFALEKLYVKNYRCFEELELELDKKLNLLVGENGAGKSTILDAIAVALGCYTGGFDNIPAVSIKTEDIRIKGYKVNDRIEAEAIIPTEITGMSYFGGELPLYWTRMVKTIKGTNTDVAAKSIIRLAREFQCMYREEEKAVIFPIVAYYKTDRFWKENAEASDKESSFYRLKGYRDWAGINTSEKQFYSWFEKMTYIELQRGKEQHELKAVRKAMEQLYRMLYDASKDINVLFTYDVANGRLEIQTESEEEVSAIPIANLSDGTRGVLTLVADIAYRMALLNPEQKDILKTPGIVLIDEIDMHLHPAWQKKIIKCLQSIFPNIQLICTTHSPSILVNIENKYIKVLDESGVTSLETKTYGREVGTILEEVMRTKVRPDEISNEMKAFEENLDAGQYDKAKECLDKMREVLGEYDADYIKASTDYTLEVEEWFDNLPEE